MMTEIDNCMSDLFALKLLILFTLYACFNRRNTLIINQITLYKFMFMLTNHHRLVKLMFYL